MRMTKLVGRRIKEDPKDAKTISHKYLIRGGYIRPVSAGIYSLLPVGKKEDLTMQAHTLFSRLREADRMHARIVYAHLPPKSGLGLALYNRMIRAAAHTVLEIR